MLSSVPIIGPYAKATELAADAVAGVANFFGFTNVPNVSDVSGVKPMPFQLASTELSEPVNKLSLQVKQETAIGAAQHGGTMEDDLNIARFAGRTSYIASSEWPTTLVPGDALFTTFVMPGLYATDAVSQVAHTPLSWASQHFQYWRGPLRYTFRVVRSPYHRGRLQITWDRMANQLDQGGSIGNPNTITTIMDLDGDDECSFVVPYMQPDLFLWTQKGPVITGPVTLPYSVDSVPPATSIAARTANGVLSVRVLNRLTAPDSSSGVTLLVFVNAEPDIEFAAPVEVNATKLETQWASISDLTASVVQSDITYLDKSEAEELTSSGAADSIYNQVFGEKVTSFREVMHRSSLSTVYCAAEFNSDTTVGTAQVNVPIKRLPPPPGVVNNGWSTATTVSGPGQRAFYTKFHPLLSIGSCFIGYKGSTNVTVNIDQTRGSIPIDTLQVRRVARGYLLTNAFRRPHLTLYSDESLSDEQAARSNNFQAKTGIEGMALTNTRTNAGMAAQLPYYSSAGFQVMDVTSEYSNEDLLTDRNSDWWQVEWRMNKSASTDVWFVGNNLNLYYSSGPDFDLVFFINVPILTTVVYS
jgi:hypothetical protein